MKTIEPTNISWDDLTSLCVRTLYCETGSVVVMLGVFVCFAVTESLNSLEAQGSALCSWGKDPSTISPPDISVFRIPRHQRIILRNFAQNRYWQDPYLPV